MRKAIAVIIGALAFTLLAAAPAHAAQWRKTSGMQTGEVVLCSSVSPAPNPNLGNGSFNISYDRSNGRMVQKAFCEGQVGGRYEDGSWGKWRGRQTGYIVVCVGQIKVSRLNDTTSVAWCRGKVWGKV